MLQLPLPDDSDNPIKLADWLELYALISADSSASEGNLERALQRSGQYKTERIDALCAEVVSELGPRATAARRAYPFSLYEGVLSLKGNKEDFITYIFCLCLSYFGDKHKKRDQVFPRRLFEDLAALAAKNFLNSLAREAKGPGEPLARVGHDRPPSPAKVL